MRFYVVLLSLLLLGTLVTGRPTSGQDGSATENTVDGGSAPEANKPPKANKPRAAASGLSAEPRSNRGQDQDSDDNQWPRFLGSSYDGVAHDPVVTLDWSGQPTLAWSLEVGEGYAMGSVAGDRYYHFDAVDPPGGGRAIGGIRQERLRAFDLASGRQLWSESQTIQYRDLLGYDNGPRTSPTIVGDRIITLGVSGLLTCRGVSDGQLLWSVDTNEKYGVVQNFFGVGASPLVWQDQVIVMVGGSPAADQDVAPMRLDRVSPNGTAVVAFDLDSGNELWRCGDDLASYSSPRPIQVGDETLVLVFARGGLMAIDPDQGQVRWRIDHRAEILESVNAIVPVVSSEKVFISECYEVGSMLLQVDGQSRRVIWQDPPRDRRRQAMRCHWATPILVDGFLYGCSGRNAPDSDFRCIEFATGQVQWVDPRRTRSSVTQVGDHLILLEERGAVEVIRPNPQQLDVVAKWPLDQSADDRPALRYPCWAAPIVVGSKLLVRGEGRVLCLELAQK